MVIQQNENLFLIDLDQKLEGFRKFISCWLYKKAHKVILVDPGPASTIPILNTALNNLHINYIDYILLTHIHIDHAGGTGLLLKKFPQAKVICHPTGIRHMTHPEKLWQGSLRILGKIAEAYGPVAPVSDTNIFYTSKIDDDLRINIIETPGHAMHHLNFLLDNILFAGEVAGVSFPFKDDFYLRIATPPRFIYEIYKDSLYMASELKCDQICFGHYGMRSDVSNVFNKAKEQLELWINTTKHFYKKNNKVSPDKIFNALLKEDPAVMTFKKLDKDIQKREKYFAFNSIKGILEYLQRN